MFFSDLSTIGPIITTLAAAVAIAGAIWGWVQFGPQKRSRRAQIRADIDQRSQTMATEMAQHPRLMEVWKGQAPETACPQADMLMGQMLSHYSTIFIAHRDGNISNDDWEPFAAEMKKFAAMPFVQRNITKAHNFGDDFRRFFTSLNNA